MKRLRSVLLGPVLIVAVSCSSGSDEAAIPEGETWCDVVAVSNALDDDFDDVEPGDAGALRSVLRRIDELGPRFNAAAPAEIADQVALYAEATGRLVDQFEAADFDFEAVDRDAITEIVQSVNGVDTEIDVYTLAECGEFLGPDDT